MEEESASTMGKMFLKDRMKGFEKNLRFFIAQKGGEYQMKIAELFAILALKKEDFRYNLSMENKSAGKFDDLVFKVLQHGQSINWFLQAKHKEKCAKIIWNDLLFEEKGDFYLRKYFKSFIDIWQSTGSTEASVSRYVIYTPAHLDFNNNQTDKTFSYITSRNNSLRFRKVTEEDDLLDANSYFMFELLADDFIRSHLRKTPGATDENIEDFLQHLRFAVGQPTVDELQDILFNESKEAAAHIDPHILRDNISREIRKSFMGRTSNSEYFTEIEIAKVILRILSETYNNSFLLDVTFSSCDVIDKIKRTDKCVIHISTCNPTLCCSKLINHLDACQEKLVFLFAEFVKVRNIVLSSLPLNELPIIVVCDMQEKSEMWNETLKSLVKRFVSSGDKTDSSNYHNETHVNREQGTNTSKLILVSYSSLDFSISRMPDLQKNIFCLEDDTYTFESLSLKSQDFIMKKVVTFQGVPVAFNSLCSQGYMPPFDSDDIETLFSKSPITLGESHTRVGQKLEIFIPREFYVKSILKVDSLHNLVDDFFVLVTPYERNKLDVLFALSRCLSLSITELEEKKNNIYLVSAEEADAEFATLCQMFPDKVIHKLYVDILELNKLDVDESDWYMYMNLPEVQCITLQWLQTRGTTNALFKYIKESETADVAMIEQKPISIVAAEPGMGKTTLLSQIAEKEKKNHSDRWVVNLRLKDIATKFLKLNKSDSISNIAKYLSEVLLEGESSLSKHLFQHSLEVKGNFILLLDGYDEIGTREEREEVCIILQKIKENSLGQVIITTRLHFKEELELAGSAIAYRLKPLNETEQETLLAETWIKNLDIFSVDDKRERVYVYVRELVKGFSQNVDEVIKSLIGIPLLVTLLAEVYERKCSLFCNMEGTQVESVIIGIDNILMLYRRFEDKKYEDFYARELTEGASVNESIRTMIADDHRHICVEVALQDIFPSSGLPCKCCLRIEPRKLQILKEDQILRIGILQKVSGRGLSFIHRTFAEYFIAIYHILQMKNKCKKFVKAFKSGFYESRFSMIRLFLDNALATSRIHKAALTNDVEVIKIELEKGKSVNLRDALGRTPCHLAASYGHVKAAELLLTRGCNTCIKDGLHKYTPAEVAAKVGKWEICSLFLSKRRNIELNIKEKCILFRYLCENGIAEPLKQMLSNLNLCLKGVFHFKKILYSTNERGCTGFIIAFLNGSVEIVRILLDKCADYSVHSIEDDLIKHLFNISYCKDEKRRVCVKLIVQYAIVSNYLRTLTEKLLGYGFLYSEFEVPTIIQCLLECDVSLNDVLLFTLLHGEGSDLEKVFTIVGEYNGDIVSFITQPFESHETMLHFAVVNSRENSVIFLIKTLETEGVNILHYILPPDVKQLSLLHRTVRSKYFQIRLCNLYIQKVRESGGNVGEFISQKDHVGRTPLHWAAYDKHVEMVEFLILKMRDEQTPIFEGTEKLPLVSCHESSDEIQFCETLLQKIMKHENNLLAYILQTDSAQMNIFDFLGVDNDEHRCYRCHKINEVCCVEWIREQMKDEIDNLFQAISAPFSFERFVNFIFGKSIEKRNNVTYLVASNITLRYNALTAAVDRNHFEIFQHLTEEIEKEGAYLIHFIYIYIFEGLNSVYDTLIELSAYKGHIQTLEFILQKIKLGGGNKPNWNPHFMHTDKYIPQTFLECLMNKEISSSQLQADVMMLLKEYPEPKYFLHGLAKFCDITVLRIYLEIIRQNDASIEYYITRRNKEGKTCVNCAAERGRKEVVEYLLQEVEEECGDCSHFFYPNEEGWTRLHSSAVGGNTYLVGFLLDKIREYKFNTFEYILQETTGGQSAIHCASSIGHAEVVKLLLTVIEMKSSVLLANILSKQEYRNTLFRDAASCGDTELLDFVVQKCTKNLRKRNVPNRDSQRKKFPKYTANLTDMKTKSKNRLRNSRSVCGFDLENHQMSPLYYAIRQDNVQVVQYLFENVGLKRDKITFVKNLVSCFHGTNTRSPFHYAHTHGSWKCLSYLIELVINRAKYLKNFLYSRDQYGKTLLHYSISSGNTRMSTLLMQTMSEEEGEDIFQWSMWSSMTLEEFLQSLLKKRNIELLVFVLRLMQRGNEGSILSLFSEQIDLVKSVIYYMAKHVDREILDLFLRNIEKEGGDIFHFLLIPDIIGKKLLEGAVFYDNLEAAEYLMGVIKARGENAADYFCKDDFIRQIALQEPEMEELKYLNDYLKKLRTVAIRNDTIEVANLLSDVTEAVNQNFLNYLPPEMNVQTYFDLAIKTRNIEMLDFIISTEECPDYDRDRRNVFHIAAISGYKSVMEFLFRKAKQECGGSCSVLSIMHCRDAYGYTPFYYAVERGHMELVKFLLNTVKEETLSNDHCTKDDLD